MDIEQQPYKFIEFSRRGRVLTAAINRPEARNAIHGELHTELARLFRDLARDAASEVIVLAGKGHSFCAGGDLRWLQNAIDDPAVFHNTADEAREILFGQLDLDKPVIARLNGAAMGLGASIVLMCDIIIAAEDASIGDPHVSVGLVAGDGGAIIWPQLVGYARAKQYLLTGDPVAVQEAERIGLINQVVPADVLDNEVYGLAERLASGATKAIRWTKRATNLPLKQVALQVFEAGMALEHMSNQTADHQEGLNAFRERRKPVFHGR